MKVVTVLGARPQFVKAAVVSHGLRKNGIIEKIIHTGQHYDPNMSDVFFTELGIAKPDYQFQIHGLSHGAMTGRMLESIERVLQDEKPDFLMVYGDTNSTLAGALAAQKMGIKIIHIEAGLRSFNMGMPEEINRIITDRISNILFCPTQTAMDNLQREGFDGFGYVRKYLVGDVMQDASLYYSNQLSNEEHVFDTFGLQSNKYLLATIHRQENTDNVEKLRAIFEAFDELTTHYPVVMPIHPRTKALLKKYSILTRVQFIDPLGYLDMIALIKNTKMVLTDSGGLQKEAYFFGKFCITLRNETEWIELVNHGFNRIVGTDKRKIMEAYQYFVDRDFVDSLDLYGGGEAVNRIIKILLDDE